MQTFISSTLYIILVHLYLVKYNSTYKLLKFKQFTDNGYVNYIQLFAVMNNAPMNFLRHAPWHTYLKISPGKNIEEELWNHKLRACLILLDI